MKNKKLLKFLSLALAVVLTVTFITIKTPATMQDVTPVNNETSDAPSSISHSVPLTITDWSGVADGNGADGYIPRTYFTDATGSQRDNMRPQISEKGLGVDGGYALVLGGDNAITKYETSFELANALKRKEDHIIKLKIKLLSGSVDTLKLGFREKETDEYKLTVLGSELSGEWQEFSFTHTTARSVSTTVMARILVSLTSVDGAKILIDDISVVAEEEELFVDGSFDRVFCEYPFEDTPADANIVYSPYDIESLKHDNLFGFTGSIEDEMSTLSLSEGKGTNDSYALTISGDNKSHTVLLPFAKNGTLRDNNEYEIALKIKTEGPAGVVGFGICENKTVHEYISFSDKDYEEFFTSEFAYYGFKYTTAAECSGHKNYIAINFNLPKNAKLYIDNIEVYNTAAAVKTELYKSGNFDYAYIKSKPIENAVYQPYDIEEYSPISNYTEESRWLKNNECASIVRDEGINNSCALKLEGTARELNCAVTIGQAAGALKANTKYIFDFKIRKSQQGKIDKFEVVYETTNFNFRVPVMSYGDESFSDGGYVRFRGTVVTPDKPGNYWDHFHISFKAAEGSAIYIDDVSIYAAEEPDKNIFPEGSFDFMYFSGEFDNSVNPDTVFVPRDISRYTNQRFFLGGDYDNHHNPEEAANHPNLKNVSIASGEGVKGSAAFKIVGDGENHQIWFMLSSLGAMSHSAEYRLGLKIKLSGNADLSDSHFNMGMKEKSNTHLALGFAGDALRESVTDQYNYYYVNYTSTDEGYKAWSYLVFDYNVPEGVTVYLDELEVVPLEDKAIWLRNADGSAVNLLAKSSFDMVDLGQSAPQWTDKIPEDEKGMFKYIYNKDEVSNSAIASLATLNDAKTGHHAIKFGFTDSAVRGECMLQMVPSKPGDTHRISFWIKVVGEVNSVTFTMCDSLWLNRTYNIDFNQYEHGDWRKVEVYYTDNVSKYDCVSYRRFKITVNAPAGSGVLIDNVEGYRVDSPIENFNVFGGGKGDFEYSTAYKPVVWSDRYTHKEGK